MSFYYIQFIEEGVTGAKVLDASNRFFTLIPHDFGLKTPPLLDNTETISSKVQMLDSLLEIEIAYNLLKGGAGDEELDPLDIHYSSLKANIKVSLLLPFTFLEPLQGQLPYLLFSKLLFFIQNFISLDILSIQNTENLYTANL